MVKKFAPVALMFVLAACGSNTSGSAGSGSAAASAAATSASNTAVNAGGLDLEEGKQNCIAASTSLSSDAAKLDAYCGCVIDGLVRGNLAAAPLDDPRVQDVARQCAGANGIKFPG